MRIWPPSFGLARFNSFPSHGQESHPEMGDFAGMLSQRIIYTHRLACDADQEARCAKLRSTWISYE